MKKFSDSEINSTTTLSMARCDGVKPLNRRGRREGIGEPLELAIKSVVPNGLLLWFCEAQDRIPTYHRNSASSKTRRDAGPKIKL